MLLERPLSSWTRGLPHDSLVISINQQNNQFKLTPETGMQNKTINTRFTTISIYLILRHIQICIQY